MLSFFKQKSVSSVESVPDFRVLKSYVVPKNRTCICVCLAVNDF